VTKEITARCLECFSIALHGICDCGKVATKKGCLFGTRELCVFADSFSNYEIVYVWIDDDGDVKYIAPVTSKETAKFVQTNIKKQCGENNETKTSKADGRET
jgi:hypothetical protein